MKGALCNEGVVVFPPKVARLVQSGSNHAYSLELRLRVGYCLFIHRKRLGEELVRNLLVACLVGDLAAGDVQAEGHVVEAVDAGVEGREHAVHKFVQLLCLT